MSKNEYGEKQITPRARLSWPFLFSPDPRDDKPKFKATLIFDPSDAQVKAGLKIMKEECLRIAQKKFGTTKGVKMPFKDGNNKSQYDGFAGNVYITVSTGRRPAVVGPDPKESVLEADIYGGCYVRASLVPATYQMGNKGVTFYLQNLQKIEDGERLGSGGGSSDPVDDFGGSESTGNDSSSYDENDSLGF